MNIAILGYGTVGRGVDEIICKSFPDVRVTRILELPDRLSDPRMTSNCDDIIQDDDISLVVECMGGIEPAHTFIAGALASGKHVVTSNKAVVAAHFNEFATLAQQNGVSFLIEATVGGGIPWIISIERASRVDRIESFSGIMNGTTNYIIEAMRNESLDFSVALKQAQGLGYAERDPSADIDGIDVANKTIISACIAFGVDCERSLPVMGIRTLTKSDLDAFASKGLTVKLFGRGVCKDGKYAASVEPMIIPIQSMEAAVPLNFNLVTLWGATIDELKFYGQGAGSLPTGNAIVQDIIDVAQGKNQSYSFSNEYEYDPKLLTSNYVLRSEVAPESATQWAPGMWLVRDVTPKEACSILEKARQQDKTAFIAALS